MDNGTEFKDVSSMSFSQSTNGAHIIRMAEIACLDSRLLYEAVIDLASDGMLTANCINFAAGILIKDLGLPSYFFNNIKKPELVQLLQSIALNVRVQEGKAALFGQVAHIDFHSKEDQGGQRVRIATEETRDNMESVLERQIMGHRRDYYFSPEKNYYTYIIRTGTVADFPQESYKTSPFLYRQVGDYTDMPEPTRNRYDNFLNLAEKSSIPLIQIFNLPENGEVRLMFVSDFESSQLPMYRKIMGAHGFPLVRAYWEPYYSENKVNSSVCSLYLRGELTRTNEKAIVDDLQDFLSSAQTPIQKLYLSDDLNFKEMLFAGNAIDFTHLFIYKESVNQTDREILASLVTKDHQDAFAKRIQDSNKSTYSAQIIEQTVRQNADLIKDLYALFDARFDPGVKFKPTEDQVEEQRLEFEKKISSRFIDFQIGYDIFNFMFKFVSCTLKTNFYIDEKRSFSFRYDNRILDPLVFSNFVYGIFFVNGHYCCGTHMRANDIARGGLRLIRVTPSNHESELDEAVLLNYALGPKAQRIKHKDICESGSKGVVIPHPAYAQCSLDALLDYTEGIMDLIQFSDREVIDYYKQPEMIFFGPDEGTAQLMDAIALRSKELGYKHWRTLTTGKSFGIPHDTFGLLQSGECFGLFDRGNEGVELEIEGESRLLTDDMETIYDAIGENVDISGMTTGSIMSSFRALINHFDEKEDNLNLMITGGPDGDLGANQIQCYKGKICLIIDGGSILYDPQGLDKKELRKLAFCRNSLPRKNSLAYPPKKLSKDGFMVPVGAKDITLPDGTVIDDGTLFHRTFLTGTKTRKYLEKSNIQAFIPCGGFKDTINQSNVKQFLTNFEDLKFIVEGANVFFDDSARRYIATETNIKQIKDSSANKGGVFSSSIAEVLTAFLLGDRYEVELNGDINTKWGLIRDVMVLVKRYAKQETQMLLKLHEISPEIPLFDLSERSSEAIFDLQDKLEKNIGLLTDDKEMMYHVLNEYIPPVLIDKLGLETIAKILGQQELVAYRNAILTKKLASIAYYRYGEKWDAFLEKVDTNLQKALDTVIKK
ncbi:MAG: glutamate dehydrogenase [Desulforhopalus sp.]|jgi:glutamate dehydrogenase